MCCYNNIPENNRLASIDATSNSDKIVDRVLQTILANSTEMDRLVTRFSRLILIIENEVQVICMVFIEKKKHIYNFTLIQKNEYYNYKSFHG
jgi:hypothetical protein